MIPAFYIYGKTDGLLVQSNPKTTKAKFSLGNLGFSGSTCISQYVGLEGNDVGIRQLVCLQGTLGDLYSYGILPDNFVSPDESDEGKITFEKGYAFCGKIDDPLIPPDAS